MRRRILGTVVVVAAIAVATLFVPAALAVRSRDAASQEVELQRDAAVAAASLPVDHPQDADFRVDDEHRFALYRPDGTLVTGNGPAHAEPVVTHMVDGAPPVVVTSGDEVVTALLVRSGDPAQRFVLRVAESRGEARSASTRSIAGLGVAALGIVGAAAVAAWGLAARLARPMEALGSAAARLDDGDFTATALGAYSVTGMAEVDGVAAALANTGQRVRRTLERERAFSADVSHQLRTPLSALRAAVEAEQVDPRTDRGAVLEDVLGQVDRLDDTLISLLRLARDTHDDRRPIDLAHLVRAVAGHWAAAFADAGRVLRLVVPDAPPQPTVSAAAVGHVIDVLLDNALSHGQGTVTVHIDAVGGAARITVADEGSLDRSPEEYFARRTVDAAGTGIGLNLARTLIDAEGGRLRAKHARPATFEVTLPRAT